MPRSAATVRRFPVPISLILLVASTACSGSRSMPIPDPDPGIPLSLATDRVRAIDSVRYDLSFNIPADRNETIDARATIRFVVRDRAAPVVLDFAPGQDRLTSVATNGKPSRFRAVNGHIVIPNQELATGENRVEIAFRAGDASLNRNPDFLYALFVPARAHLAFPCFDQPDVRARFTLELIVPSDWQAVSNGPETSREPAGNRVRIRYGETQPIPTYLFTFAAGRFQVETAERGGRTYRMFHRETDAKKVARNRDTVFDLHAAALAWLEQYTAILYPFGKFDFVLIPSFQFGGMEHPGAIFYNAASILLDESATQNQMLGRASVISHETTHMWFGDLVTMRWFNDVWMKEVFANFMAAKIVNPSFPEVDHDLRFLVANYPLAYSVDRTEGTHPIRQELDNLDDAGSLYGAIVYQKAPIVMRQLERIVGPERFQDGLRAYLKQFAFGNATWLDLVKVLDERTDADLTAWSHAWVEEGGRPEIRTELDRNPDGGIRRLEFVQSDRRYGRSLPWTQRADVLVGTADGVHTIPIELHDGRIEVADVAALGRPQFVLPAGNGLAYGGFALDNATRSFLLDHMRTLKGPLQRGAAWVTLWEELLDGRVRPVVFIEAALGALPDETTEQNVQLLTGYLDDAFWTFLGEQARGVLGPKLEQVLRTGLQHAPSSSLKSTYFSAFRSIATTRDGVAFLERVWRRQEKIPGLTFAEADEATMALELAVRGVPDAQAILEAERGRLQNPDRKARFEFVMPALSASEATRDAFFNSLSDVKNRRREPWVQEGLRYLNHPLRAPHSELYVRPALDLLEEIQRTGDIFFPKNWLDATLVGHSSQASADAVRGFLAGHPDYPRRLYRITLQSADTVFRATRILEARVP